MIALRVVALSAIYLIVFGAVSAALLSHLFAQPAPSAGESPLAALLAVSVVTASVLSYIVLRSRWAGWKLVLTVFVALYGVATVMPQSETAFFITRLPAGALPRFFLSGAIVAALFAPVVVLVLGKRRADPSEPAGGRLRFSLGGWLVRLAAIVVLYEAIYFTFGYFIAWQSAAVRAYYGGRDPGSFLAQMRTVVHDTPMLVPFQAVRAILWTAIAVPVVRTMKGGWWEAALAVALLFAMTSVQLLLPNPIMPHAVRMAHLLETATSNFLFGWSLVLVLASGHAAREIYSAR